jgi:hypothetical protein
VLTKNGIRTLVDISLSTQHEQICYPDLTQLKDLLLRKGAIATNTPTYQFLPLTIDVFGCLHKHANVFLHDCANAI